MGTGCLPWCKIRSPRAEPTLRPKEPRHIFGASRQWLVTVHEDNSNAWLNDASKSDPGFVCRACGFDFSIAYPGIVENQFIEAHPRSDFAAKRPEGAADPTKDFAVLCSNCHRMIHRGSEPSDLDAFKKTLKAAASP